MFLRSAFTVGSLTGVSRVTGLLRDMLLAAILGAGPLSDAFLVAFKLPNFFRRLFAEGAFNAAFVPFFSRLYAKEGLPRALIEAEQVLMVLIVALLGLVVCVESALPWLMYVIAPGFADNASLFEETLSLTRIMFPYILLISLGAFYGGLLNTVGQFSAPAASPILLNLFMVGALILSQYLNVQAAHMLSWGVMAAGGAQLLWLMICAHQTKLSLKWRVPALTPAVRHVLKGMGPGALGAGVMQVNLLVDVMLASFLPSGAISFLFYADRFNQLPLGMVGIALSTALLPLLSKHLQKEEHTQAQEIQNRALEFALLLTLPAAIALMVLAPSLIDVLFGRKNFGPYEVSQTAQVLAAFSTGLPAYVGVKIFATTFFARYDTKTPVKIAIICMGVNVALTLILMSFWAHVGIALATSLSSWLNFICLGYLLHKQKAFQADKRLKERFTRIVIASMALFIFLGLWERAVPLLHQGGFFWRALSLISGVSLGLLFYFLIAVWTKALHLPEIRLLLKRSDA